MRYGEILHVLGGLLMAVAVAMVGYSSLRTIRKIEQRVETVSNEFLSTIVTANEMTVSIQSAH
ncbi:MAG: hypothetical protein KAJ13_03025, partial [Gemmatimonadetes bacterium]|nr:hypothetical protein [Gemmatimonadota bacterium]